MDKLHSQNHAECISVGNTTRGRMLRLTVSTLLVLLLAAGWLTPIMSPAGANDVSKAALSALQLPNLSEFSSSLLNGSPGTLVGVYADGVMALPVVQQPENNPGFVSSNQGVLTQFRMAGDYGSTGILAHNTLAGADFFNLNIGQEIVLIYGDGTYKNYTITYTDSYQALSPRSPYSSFIELGDSAIQLTAADLFRRIYAQEDRLVFQTCIEAYGDTSWGRLFVIAEPVHQIVQAFIPMSVWRVYPD
jgi:hypothetical protein